MTNRRRAGRALAVVAAYAALALALFRPTPWQLAHTAPAFDGHASDALMYVWALAWVSRALFTDPLHLFDAPICHPATLTLAYSDHMIGQALVGLPIWLASENPLLEYNLLVLASYVLGGAAAFALARALGASAVAAGAAGLVFAFNPYRFHSPLWLQVLFTPFVPLTLLAWLRFLRTRSAGAWAAWVACWVLHGLMGMYLTLYFAIVMGALVLYALAAAPPPRDRRLVLGLLAAPLATAVALAPTLLPYAALRVTQGHLRTFGLDTLPEFFLPGPGTLSALALGTEQLGRFGPGLLVWALALVGLVAGARAGAPAGLPAPFVRRAMLLGLGVTLLLVVVPIRYQQLVPGLDMIRATNRAFYLSLLFLGLLVADGVDRLARGPRGRAVAVVLLLVLVADVGRPPRERLALPVGAEMPPVYQAVRALPDDAVVYDHVPGAEPLARAMYFQTFHRKRMPNGYTGFWNPATRFAMHRLPRFPAPETLRFLQAIGVTHVVRHFPGEAAAAAAVHRPVAGLADVRQVGAALLVRVEPGPAEPAAPVAPLPRASWSAADSAGTRTLDALADGDATTRWTLAVERRTPTAPHLTLDLGRSRPVAGVRVTAPLEDADATQWSRVLLSDDGVTFTLAASGFEPDSFAALYEAPARIRWWEARFPPRPARYVRLTNAELAFWGGTWTIAELDVLAPDAAEP